MIFEDTQNVAHPVFSADLLSIILHAAGVNDPHFVNRVSETRNFGYDLGLGPGPILLDADSANHFAPKHFAACLHVGEVGVDEDVGRCREESIFH